MNFTLGELVGEIRRLAGVEPDRVTPEPANRYSAVVGGHAQPHCLVGHAVYNLSDDPNIVETLVDWDSRNDGYGEDAATLLRGRGHRGKAADWVFWAQDAQDGGASWAEAVRRADAEAYA
ncbi:hypothetical protein [Tomitella gaofuii]|uniref:hypothetical protein n=1 Tax=Tomitella gaofuii TaxID=2760083 RepID=UPI0015F8D2A3|nr:hypothetical protein [Tomitella gaofuii]